MSRRRYRQKILIDTHSYFAVNNALNSNSCRTVVSMHDALAAEFRGKLLVVCNVIAMR